MIKHPLLPEYFTMTGKKSCHKVISLELAETSPCSLRRAALCLNFIWILQQCLKCKAITLGERGHKQTAGFYYFDIQQYVLRL